MKATINSYRQRRRMKLSEILKPEAIISDIKARDKMGILKEMIQTVTEQFPSLDKGILLQILLEREKLGSTGIGDGVALPHGKVKELSQLQSYFGRSKEGLCFDSIDEQPAHLFFLLLAPENSVGIHLKALAKISRMLKDGNFRQRLLAAESRDKIYQILMDKNEEF